jgi:lysozyme family protein
MRRIDICLDWIIRAEGGLSADPNDRGGLTKYGISKKAYPDLDIAALTEAEARSIYERDYWIPCRCADLPAGVDQVVLDGAVLMGVSAVSKQLQRALKIKVDGKIGILTVIAAQKAGDDIIPALMAERALYLAKTPTWKHHGRGWMIRSFKLMKEIS